MEPHMMVPCFLCQRSFQMGPHAYLGRYIQVWRVSMCEDCIDGNHDGIVPEHHPGLLDRMRAEGIEPTINDRGWIVIPPR